MLSAMSSAASRKSQKKRKGRAEVVVTVVMGACASKSESPQPQPPTDGSDHCDACGENLTPHPLGVTPRFQPCRHALCTACLRNLATDDNFVHGVGFRCPALGRILPPFDECDAPRALCTTVISPGAFLPYLGGSPYPLTYLARETPEVAGYIRYHEAMQSCSVCGEFRGLTTEAQEWYRPSDTSRCRHYLCGSCQRGIVSAFIERGPEAGPKLICPAIDGPDDTRCTVPILPQSLYASPGYGYVSEPSQHLRCTFSKWDIIGSIHQETLPPMPEVQGARDARGRLQPHVLQSMRHRLVLGLLQGVFR